jgi:hypothetical protein
VFFSFIVITVVFELTYGKLARHGFLQGRNKIHLPTGKK